MAKPTPESRPALLVAELWALGDVVLAMPFLREAVRHARVTLLAKPHAEPLLRRLAPDARLVTLDAPWTAFTGKYRLLHWPWRTLGATVGRLRSERFDLGVSVRRDPRDHVLLALAGARRRLGFARAGSRVLLHRSLPRPERPHRAEAWRTLAAALGWSLAAPHDTLTGPVRHIAMHIGAAQPVRRWPEARFRALAGHLRARGVTVDVIEPQDGPLGPLLDRLARADAFIGNDSGPGHLAALLGRPTFTVFGNQIPLNFSPVHPRAGWIEGLPCPHKPCYDACRYPRAHCLQDLDFEPVRARVDAWLDGLR